MSPEIDERDQGGQVCDGAAMSEQQHLHYFPFRRGWSRLTKWWLRGLIAVAVLVPLVIAGPFIVGSIFGGKYVTTSGTSGKFRIGMNKDEVLTVIRKEQRVSYYPLRFKVERNSTLHTVTHFDDERVFRSDQWHWWPDYISIYSYEFVFKDGKLAKLVTDRRFAEVP